MKKQRDAKIVEEVIKKTIDLFSGAEHLQDIFDHIRSLEDLIPK